MRPPDRPRPSLAGILVKYIAPLAVSVGLCWLLLRDYDLSGMVALARSECMPLYIALGMGLTVVAHVFRALRWRLQLRALGIDAPLWALVISIFGTYAINLVFPRLGEVWRSGYIARRQRAPFATVLGSMVADRLADTLAVLIITILAVLLAGASIMSYLEQTGHTPVALARTLTSPWLWAGIALAAGIAWWLLARKSDNRWIRRTRDVVRQMWHGFAVVGSMRGRGRWLLYTAGIWGSFFLSMYAEFFSFPFTASVAAEHGLTTVLVTFVLSSLSMGVPSNGGIGPWQWAVMFALSVYAVPQMQGATFANTVMAVSTVFNILLGIITFIVIAATSKRPARNNNNTQSPIQQ